MEVNLKVLFILVLVSARKSINTSYQDRIVHVITGNNKWESHHSYRRQLRFPFIIAGYYLTGIEVKGANLRMALVDDGFKLIVKSQEQI